MNKVAIRPIQKNDLFLLWELIYKEQAPEWKRWDAPYFPHQPMTYEAFLPQGETWCHADHIWVVTVNEEVCGIVTYYWEHEPSLWLEVGIVLHEAKHWGKGIGTVALTKWMTHLFTTIPLVRVGFTTWSGNERMIRVGEKLGMREEARIRKVRLFEGQYYDSVRMGVLREEWPF